MKEQDFLQFLETMLKEEKLDCSLEPDRHAPPFGKLLVFLGHDALDRERALIITVQEQNLGEALKTQPEKPKFVRIQFEVCLPFPMKEHAANETGSLLAFLNRMLELPGFEMDEINGKIFYRYVLLTSNEGANKELVMGIIGVILLFLEMFSEAIERIASGKNSFNELLEQVLQSAEALGK